MRRVLRRGRIAYLLLASTISTPARADLPAFQEAVSLAQEVEKAPGVDARAKAEVRAELQQIRAQVSRSAAECSSPRQALQSVRQRLKSELTGFDQRMKALMATRPRWQAFKPTGFGAERARLQAMARAHNANRPDPRNRAAVAAYNAEARRGNAEIAAFKARVKASFDAARARYNAARQPFEQRRNQIRSELMALGARARTEERAAIERLKACRDQQRGRIEAAVSQFRSRARKLLFQQGRAYRQLVEAAGGKRGEIFDGRRDPSAGSSVVDARNVKPWAPGEREAEWKKPRVQLPQRRPPPVVPPPPAPGAEARRPPQLPQRTTPAPTPMPPTRAQPPPLASARPPPPGGPTRTPPVLPAPTRTTPPPASTRPPLTPASPRLPRATPRIAGPPPPSPALAAAERERRAREEERRRKTEQERANALVRAKEKLAESMRKALERARAAAARGAKAAPEGVRAVESRADAIRKALQAVAGAARDRASGAAPSAPPGARAPQRLAMAPRSTEAAKASKPTSPEAAKPRTSPDPVVGLARAIRELGDATAQRASEVGRALGKGLQSLKAAWDGSTLGRAVGTGLREIGASQWGPRETGVAIGAAVRRAAAAAGEWGRKLEDRGRAIGSALAELGRPRAEAGAANATTWLGSGKELVASAGSALREALGSAARSGKAAALAAAQVLTGYLVAASALPEAAAAKAAPFAAPILKGLMRGVGSAAADTVKAGWAATAEIAKSYWDVVQYARGIYGAATGDPRALGTYQPRSVASQLSQEGKLVETGRAVMEGLPHAAAHASREAKAWWADLTSGDKARLERASVKIGEAAFVAASIAVPATAFRHSRWAKELDELRNLPRIRKVAKLEQKRLKKISKLEKRIEAERAALDRMAALDREKLRRMSKLADLEERAAKERDKLEKFLARATVERFAHEVGLKGNVARAALEIARREQVVIQLRPTTPFARALRRRGHPPKPDFLHLKTADELDLALGAPRKSLGQVVDYVPKDPDYLPDRAVPKGFSRKQLRDRYDLRIEEKKRFGEDMERLRRDGKIQVGRDGIVRDPKSGKGFTGDDDLFDVTGPNGEPVSKDKLARVMRALDEAGAEVEHGDVMHWRTDKGRHSRQRELRRRFREEIIDSHREKTTRGTAGKPLVEFRPDGTYRTVYAPPKPTAGVAAPPDAPGATAPSP